MATEASKTLEGRVAIVTGASRGIGKAISERLASAGATVVLAARSLSESDDLPGTVEATAKEIEGRGGKALPMACDVEAEADRARLVESTLKRFGRVDILVNNAGRAVLEHVVEMDYVNCESQARQYLLGPLDLILRCVPHMRNQGAGWIINLGSATANPPYRKTRLNWYGALKAAVHRMTEGFAVELIDHNISVNAVSPVSTIMTPGVDSLHIITPEMMHRVETIEHIAEAALTVCESKPADLNGRILFSYKFLDEIGRPTRSLDGKTIVHPR
ncbi:MAG TPA: SDR family NAD(P)-dependent oxidoreductase [Alphaproteobacteria bacterium]|nr:SDR family NAD(P)-dependent oxidoreductase [Alphaproteobacteria bacterium]